MIFIELFLRFALVGLFSIGGGLATLPFLIEMGETTGWFTNADISNMVAISESTPGPLGINMATYIGNLVCGSDSVLLGILGGLVASLGVITPSLIVILIICQFLKKFRDSKYVNYAFYGLRAASLALIAAACLEVAHIAFIDSEIAFSMETIFEYINYKSVILFAIVFACMQKFKKIHPIVYIVVAAVAGIIFQMG